MTIGRNSPNTAAVFVDSMTVLASSSYPSIVSDSLSFVASCLAGCSPSNHVALLASKLIPRIISIPSLQDLSVIDNQNIIGNILDIQKNSLQLSSTDSDRFVSTDFHINPESIRDVVLIEVLIPIEPSLVQISRNPHILSWCYECRETLKFLTKLFEMSAFHQRILDFIASSRIPMAFQSLLTKVETENAHSFIIKEMNSNINKWIKSGADTARRWRILLQTLEQEGFLQSLEQALRHDTSTINGYAVRFFSLTIMINLGMNSSLTLKN